MSATSHNIGEETGGPDMWVTITTEVEDHEGHEWEPSETLYDNAIEHTRWGYCHDCRHDFMIESWMVDWEF